MLLNDPDQIRLRRSQAILFNIGTGIVIFGVWTIVKTLLTLLTGRYQIFKTAQELSAGSEYFVSPRIFAVLLVIIFAAMTFIDIWLRFYVVFTRSPRGLWQLLRQPKQPRRKSCLLSTPISPSPVF